MMTMVHVIETLEGRGGTPRKLLSLARHVDRSRVQLVFVHFTSSPLADAFTQLGWPVHAVQTQNPFALSRHIRAIVCETAADVICTHFTRSLVAGYLAARWQHQPLIHNEHSSAHYRTGAGKYLARWILPTADLIVCNSRHTCSSITTHYPGTGENTLTIYNPVEPRPSSLTRNDVRTQLGLTDNHLLIGHIGGMLPVRDQRTLVGAFAAVHRTAPHLRLLFVGDGPERPALESDVRKRGLSGAVIFTGYSDEVGSLLSGMDLYVNPTLDEGFGIAVVEAMLAGIPTILADVGAHPELLIPDKTGWLYQAGSTSALATRLHAVVHDDNIRQRVGAAGRRYAQHHFSPARYAEQYVKAAEIVIGRRRAHLKAA